MAISIFDLLEAPPFDIVLKRLQVVGGPVKVFELPVMNQLRAGGQKGKLLLQREIRLKDGVRKAAGYAEKEQVPCPIAEHVDNVVHALKIRWTTSGCPS